MDNVVNFLLDYYIWILAVLAIVVITIIGFLVDSKQKRKKKEMSEVQTVQSIPEENVNSNINFNNEQISSVNGNVINGMNYGVANQMPVQNIGLQQQPVNTVSNPITNSNVEVTLGNQKPHFETKEVQIPTAVQPSFVNESVMAPRPVNAVSINTPMQPNVNIPVMNQNAIGGASQPYVSPQSQTQQKLNTIPAYNNMQAQVSVMPNQNNVSQTSVVYNNQQPVNYQNVSIQQVSPYSQHSAIPVNSNQPLGQSDMMSGVQIQQPVVSNSNTSQPVVTTTNNLGIGFVTGESGSAGDSDSWKL